MGQHLPEKQFHNDGLQIKLHTAGTATNRLEERMPTRLLYRARDELDGISIKMSTSERYIGCDIFVDSNVLGPVTCLNDQERPLRGVVQPKDACDRKNRRICR